MLIAASALCFSTAGLFTGLLAVDGWTMLFWRGLFGGLLIAAWVVWRHGAASPALLRGMGWPGFAVAACSTLGTICYIHALRLSTVAEVTVIYAAAPFIAAIVAWSWLRELPGRITLCASAIALLGVLVMAGGGVGSRHLAGNALALAMTGLIATMMVTIRRYRHLPMLPAASASALGCAALAFPFAAPASVSLHELLWLAVFGSVQFGLGLLLLTLGSRLLPGPRAALIGNIELPLAPLWAWLFLGNVPTGAAWAGGAAVVLALALDLLAQPPAAPDDPDAYPPASAPGVTPSAARKAAPKAGALA